MIQNTRITICEYFGTLALLLFLLQLLQIDGQKFKVTDFSKCIETKDSFVQLTDVSLAECVEACITRHACLSIGYRVAMKFCELHKEDNLVTSKDKQSCIFIERNDMDTTHAKICSCLHDGHVCNLISGLCEIKECGHLNLLNGTVYGNRHYIGAKLQVSCDKGFEESNGIKQVTCNNSGDWDPTPVCKALTTTAAPEQQTTVKEYYCPVYPYDPDYKIFDLHSDGVIIDNRLNITFQTKGARDAHILLQNERNVVNRSVIEIVLGGGANTWSGMRNGTRIGATFGTVIDAKLGAVLDPNVYQTFWISWSGGCVKVGKENIVGTNKILDWCGLTFPISGMRIGYGWGSDGYFKFEI